MIFFKAVWFFLKALDPRIWLGIAIAAAVAGSYLYVYRMGGNGPRAELAALEAQFTAFKVQTAEEGRRAQDRADAEIKTQMANAVTLMGEYDATKRRLDETQKRLDVRNAAAAATYARVRDESAAISASGRELPGPGADPGKADAVAAELVACRRGFDQLRADAAQDALTLKTLQDLLHRNGHPIKN